MIYIIYSFPNLEMLNSIYFREEKQKLTKFPRTPEDLRVTSEIIGKYTKSHFYHVLTLFIWIYVLYILILIF